MNAALELQGIAASLGLAINQETITADQYRLTRPPLPSEAAAQTGLRRYNLDTGEIKTTNAAEPVTFDPRTLLQPLNQAADASRRQLVQDRSQDAANFAGMKLLYELFTSGDVSGMYDSAAYTYTFPKGTPITSDLLLRADRYLEQHAPFHLDWDAIVRSDQGTTVTVRAGIDQRPAVTRSAAFRLDEKHAGGL